MAKPAHRLPHVLLQLSLTTGALAAVLPAIAQAQMAAGESVQLELHEQRPWTLPADVERIAIADPDAGAWTEAIDRAFGLHTLTGLSLCLRLLALVEVLARAARLEPFFDVTPAGVDLHPSLLAAAAALPLDHEARLDETALVERWRPKALPSRGAANPARLP